MPSSEKKISGSSENIFFFFANFSSNPRKSFEARISGCAENIATC